MSRCELDAVLQNKVNKDSLVNKLSRKASKVTVEMMMKEMEDLSVCLDQGLK
jgi:hypothetical protein